jgi:hypothetical protein
MWDKIKDLVLWIWGPRKTTQQNLQEVADSMDEISYQNTPNVQGQKLEVEPLKTSHLKLVSGGKK